MIKLGNDIYVIILYYHMYLKEIFYQLIFLSDISVEEARKIIHLSMEFSTKAIHVGQDPAKWTHRAVVPPISMATTFQQFAPAQHAVSNIF